MLSLTMKNLLIGVAADIRKDTAPCKQYILQINSVAPSHVIMILCVSGCIYVHLYAVKSLLTPSDYLD